MVGGFDVLTKTLNNIHNFENSLKKILSHCRPIVSLISKTTTLFLDPMCNILISIHFSNSQNPHKQSNPPHF
ncbi:hypothetical protein QVD17_20122 [Tagetes erecta]|uniref:Uncharacterized protein n=1 Tax=Tagetes erecta TaxID=13708 RepID=A0AAD8KKQ9_TARER|nr:hypothetical protein QVD17_20122 [Tagetes erecta]